MCTLLFIYIEIKEMIMKLRFLEKIICSNSK